MMTIKEFMYRHYVIGMLKGLDGRSYEILAPHQIITLTRSQLKMIRFGNIVLLILNTFRNLVLAYMTKQGAMDIGHI